MSFVLSFLKTVSLRVYIYVLLAVLLILSFSRTYKAGKTSSRYESTQRKLEQVQRAQKAEIELTKKKFEELKSRGAWKR